MSDGIFDYSVLSKAEGANPMGLEEEEKGRRRDGKGTRSKATTPQW